MKILRIRLRNLASLAGTHSVDFTREPLASAGLFSISGPTGSGKSTLLDALCLALYENTPRLAAARGEPMPIGADVLQPGNPANLLRRGSAEGFAEVAFLGVDGLPYTARWSVRRARQRVEGSLQKSEMALFRGDVVEGNGGELLQGGRKTEVLDAIEQKVGLTFTQFTRAVLLAQNEFAVFLKADDKERAVILQALTGSQRFERLSIAAFDRNRREQELIREIEARMQGHVPLAPDLRAAAEEAGRMAGEAVGNGRREVDVRLAHVAWFERLRELESAVTDAGKRHEAAILQYESASARRAELDRATEVLQSAPALHQSEHDALQHRAACLRTHGEALARQEAARVAAVNAARVAADARAGLQRVRLERESAAPILQQARILDAQLAPAAARLGVAHQERLAADQRLRDAIERIAQLTGQRTLHQREIESLETGRSNDGHLQPFVSDAAGWGERLVVAIRARGRSEDARAQVERSARTLRELDEQIDRLRPSVDAARLALDHAVEEHVRRIAALQAIDTAALARERQELDVALASMAEARAHLGTAQLLGTQIDQQTEELARCRCEVEQQTQSLADLQQRRLPVAEAASNTARDLLANAQAAVGKAAGQMRAGLLPSQPCPVCGALDHPYSDHVPEADAALDSLRAAAELHQKQLEDLRAEVTRLTTLSKADGARVQKLGASIAELGQHRTSAWAQAFREPALAGQAHLSQAGALEFLEAGSVELNRRRQQLAQREQLQRNASSEADLARRAEEAARKGSDSEQGKLNALEHSRAAARAAHDADQLHAGRTAGEENSAFTAVLPLLEALPEPERQRAGIDPSVTLLPVRERLQELARIEAALQKGRLDLQAVQARLDAESHGLQIARNGATLAVEAERAASHAHSTLLAQRQTLLGGRSVDDEALRLDGLHQLAERAVTEATEAEVGTGNALADATGAVRAAEEAVTLASGRAAVATAGYDSWLAAFALRSGVGLARAYVDEVLARGEAWFTTERAALAVLAQAVGTTAGERTARSAARDEHLARRVTEESEADVVADLALRRARLQETEEQFAKARAELMHDDLRRSQSAELLEQLNRQRAQAAPWEKLSDLIGSADGARFRAIAQRHTLDLLLWDANAQLDRIAPRYRLERLKDSLNLVVVDRDMGDERRGVHSLSGGESFLVSLALALGLASLTSSQVRIESLFIDEGFGSLDQETLNTAMGALMQLEAQGRKVGIISHVTEMADAIPVQIRVARGRGGASRLVVPGAPPTDPPPAEAGESVDGPKPAAPAPRRRSRSAK